MEHTYFMTGRCKTIILSPGINKLVIIVSNTTQVLGAYHEFWGTGEFSWNCSTLIDIHLQDEKEIPRGENLWFFLLEAF